MAGLLDFINTPQGMGLLSAVAGGMAGARRGTPWNNVGRGLVTGVQGYAGAQDQLRADEEKSFQNQYRQMQMEQIQQTMAKAKGEREWKAGLPGVMAPKLTGSTDQGRQLAEQNAAFGQEGLPALAESAQYAQPDAPLNMNYGVDKQAVQDYMMQPDSPYADKMIEQQYFPDKEDRTAEQRNWEYAQTLPEDQRALFTARSGGSSTPATVQEWEYFSKLPPQAQARFLEMKRNPQIMNLGGTVATRAAGGGIGESYTVTPKITETPEYQAAQETAKATATAGVAQGTESTKKGRTADALLSNITEAETILKEGNASGSLIGKGVSATKGLVGISDATTQANRKLKLISGWMVANVPRMEGPQSNFDVQNYREMAATVGDESIPVKDREAALGQLRTLQEKYKTINGAQPTKQRGGTLSQGEILNVELQDALAKGDTQNVSLIRQEMRRMGIKETGQQKPASKAASFDLPPNAKQYEGKTLRDTKSGKRFKSVGGRWQEVK